MQTSRALRIATLAVAVLAFGCAPPIGVRHLSPPEANRAQTDNILSDDHLSVHSSGMLQRLGLRDRFDDDPVGVLRELHAGLGGFDEHERTLALSELSFAYAERSGDRTYYLAAAVYAWAFLMEEAQDADATTDRYDERFRFAANLYNRAIALGLASGDGNDLDLSSRSVHLFFGDLDLETAPELSLIHI